LKRAENDACVLNRSTDALICWSDFSKIILYRKTGNADDDADTRQFAVNYGLYVPLPD